MFSLALCRQSNSSLVQEISQNNNLNILDENNHSAIKSHLQQIKASCGTENLLNLNTVIDKVPQNLLSYVREGILTIPYSLCDSHFNVNLEYASNRLKSMGNLSEGGEFKIDQPALQQRGSMVQKLIAAAKIITAEINLPTTNLLHKRKQYPNYAETMGVRSNLGEETAVPARLSLLKKREEKSNKAGLLSSIQSQAKGRGKPFTQFTQNEREEMLRMSLNEAEEKYGVNRQRLSAAKSQAKDTGKYFTYFKQEEKEEMLCMSLNEAQEKYGVNRQSLTKAKSLAKDIGKTLSLFNEDERKAMLSMSLDEAQEKYGIKRQALSKAKSLAKDTGRFFAQFSLNAKEEMLCMSLNEAQEKYGVNRQSLTKAKCQAKYSGKTFAQFKQSEKNKMLNSSISGKSSGK